MCEVGGMVLAAGLSERMGGSVPKQLLPLGSGTVAARTVRRAESSQLDRVVVVTGHRGNEVAEVVAGGRAEIAYNPRYRSGNLSSFQTGAAALAECNAVIVLLADMPGVTTAMIDELVAAWHRHHPWAARSIYTDGPAHPLLLSARAVQAAVGLEGPKGVWRFLASAPESDVLAVRFPVPIPTDVNTPADYERVLHRERSS